MLQYLKKVFVIHISLKAAKSIKKLAILIYYASLFVPITPLIGLLPLEQ
jgi:hypothetical protein